MFAPLRRVTMFALYQMSVLAGILLLPVAIMAQRVGVPFPMHRIMEVLANAYEQSVEPRP